MPSPGRPPAPDGDPTPGVTASDDPPSDSLGADGPASDGPASGGLVPVAGAAGGGPRRRTARGRALIAVALLVVLLGTAWVAGTRPAPTPSPAAGSVRLGPDPGEPVPTYLAGLLTQRPEPGPAVLALVQLSAPIPVGDLPALLPRAETPSDAPGDGPIDAGVGAGSPPPGTVVTAVFRVPVPRVQTALRFADVEPGVPLAQAVDNARSRAATQAEADAAARDTGTGDSTAGAGTGPGRARAVAAVEAAALIRPDCPCLLAVLINADRGMLDELGSDQRVRAVHAAPVGTVAAEVALSPLLPEQTTAVTPPPDDGAVPDPGTIGQ